MVTTWPKNFPALGTGANYLAESIQAMTGGRLEIKVYGAGELVPASGVFDAVSGGTAEMGHGAAYYWKGKHEATQFFAAVPFGLNAAEINGWLRYGGGQPVGTPDADKVPFLLHHLGLSGPSLSPPEAPLPDFWPRLK